MGCDRSPSVKTDGQSCSDNSQNFSQAVKIHEGSERIIFFIYIFNLMVYNMKRTG